MSSFAIKILACITMLLDHIGFMFFQDSILLRAVGRLAYPLFAFQASVGYQHTKNKEKYLARMLLFALLCQIPFWWFSKLSLGDTYAFTFNIGATLTLGLLAIYSWDKIKNPFLKLLGITTTLALSLLLRVDYSFYGVLMVFLFYVLRRHKYATAICFYLLVVLYCAYKKSIFNIPAIFAILPILLFNGKKGKDDKHLFYFVYPIHMILFVIIKLIFSS